MWKVVYLYLFAFVKAPFRLPRGYRIVHNGKPFSHLAFGLFIRRFFSLTFKTVYEVSFLNNRNEVVRVQFDRKEYVEKYKDLPGFVANQKTVWKR